LAEGDLEGFLGGQAARVGQAMAYQAERVAALARGAHPDVVMDPAVYHRGGQMIIPAVQVGQVQLRLDVPHGVLAIGPELDVWRPVESRLLWSPTDASPYTGGQAAELVMEAARRWHGFVEEQLRLWCAPMAPRNPPRVPGDFPVS